MFFVNKMDFLCDYTTVGRLKTKPRAFKASIAKRVWLVELVKVHWGKAFSATVSAFYAAFFDSNFNYCGLNLLSLCDFFFIG